MLRGMTRLRARGSFSGGTMNKWRCIFVIEFVLGRLVCTSDLPWDDWSKHWQNKIVNWLWMHRCRGCTVAADASKPDVAFFGPTNQIENFMEKQDTTCWAFNEDGRSETWIYIIIVNSRKGIQNSWIKRFTIIDILNSLSAFLFGLRLVLRFVLELPEKSWQQPSCMLEFRAGKENDSSAAFDDSRRNNVYLYFSDKNRVNKATWSVRHELTRPMTADGFQSN